MITPDRAVFRDALPAGGRLLGLDVGTKTIGTALCDAGWSFASPADLVKRTRFTADKAALVKLIAAQQVKGLVIGLPLNLLADRRLGEGERDAMFTPCRQR